MVRTGMIAILAALLGSACFAAQERPLPAPGSAPENTQLPEPVTRTDPHPAPARTDRQAVPGTDSPAGESAGPVVDELGHVMTPPAQTNLPPETGVDVPDGPEPENR